MKDRYNVPQDNRRGCLCKDGKRYSCECCKGNYWNQGIGKIRRYIGGFSNGFSNGFDISEK